MRFTWTTHKEKDTTGHFRIVDGCLQVEVVIEETRSTEEHSEYRAYRPASADDCERERLRAMTRRHCTERTCSLLPSS